MAGFANVAQLAAANAAGRTHTCSLRKVPSQASVAGGWADLSMAAGNPKPQYYAATPLLLRFWTGSTASFMVTPRHPHPST